MNKAFLWGIPVVAVLGGWYFFGRGGSDSGEIEYRYAPVKRGDLVRSISSTGQLVALTTVDVKSKAGGKIVRLAVDEGSIVKKGDLIAVIDPSDTQALFDQATADLQSAQARAKQAEENYQLQIATSKAGIQEAQAGLDAARSRLARAQLEYDRQPTLAKSQLNNAQAAFDSAAESLDKFNTVTGPQMRKDTQSSANRSKVSMDTAKSNLDRQLSLLSKGYVAQATVDQALASYESAKAEYDSARQRLLTLDDEIQAERRTLELAKDRAAATLEQAKASQSDVAISKRSLDEAKTSVKQAQIALQRAKDNQRNIEIRRTDIVAAKAGAVRSKVSVENAKVQLDSTTVVAPRDGVVTLKYLEEGTIIPPGTSTFAQGTSLVQLSDVTQLFVDCNVDEADIGNVKQGQKVLITAEAYPGKKFEGVVERVSPSAITEQNMTSVKVRVRVLPGAEISVVPGMSATCEFITLEHKDVIIAPSQALKREGEKVFVKVKTSDPLKPVMREIKTGESGNDGVEILSGLEAGEEIVVGEINLKEMEELQRQMQEDAQGGGLAGGGGPPRRR